MATATVPSTNELRNLRNTLHEDFISCLKFWLKYSIDNECGGYFNCINDNGNIYDTTKHVWLQCRAVWMFCRIYANPILSLPKYKSLKREIYAAAKHGIEFITKKVIFYDNKNKLYRCYFSVDRNGNGLKIQRKIFSECFFVMALISYSSMIYNIYSSMNKLLDNSIMNSYINDADKYLKLAINVFKDIQIYIKNPELLGFKYSPKHIPNNKQFEPLNQPMICLNIIDEFKTLIPSTNTIYKQNIDSFDSLAVGYVDNIIKHVDFDNKCVRENVQKDGGFDNETCDGRTLNPGHAIEAAWFLREYIRKYHNTNGIYKNLNINTLTRNIYNWSFSSGWDIKNGGLYSFQDVLNNKPVTLLESNMKLWWPINESMITSLILLRDSVRNKNMNQIKNDWNMVKTVCDYGLNVFSDTVNNGGWYGYLKENSKIELTIKGGSYKGFFHVPRSLMFCVNILDEIILQSNDSKLQSKL